MTDMIKRENAALSQENMEVVAAVVREMMTPIMQSIGQMLEHNTQAMDQIAAAQQITNDRIEALEKQVRLNTPMSGKQVQYINDAIKSRARELLDKRQCAEDKKAITKLGNAIRKSVLARHGVGSLREVPKHEYTVAMNQIGMWNDLLVIKDVVREARERAEHMEGVECFARMDGSPAHAHPEDQPNQRAVHAAAEGLSTESDPAAFEGGMRT